MSMRPRCESNVSPSKKATKSKSPPTKSARKKSSVRSLRVSQPHNEMEVKPISEIQPATSHKKKTNFFTNVLRVLALLAVIAITLYVFSIRNQVERFAVFGYPGVFLIALLANATVLLPAPGVAVIYAMGAIFNPLGGGIAAGTGGALGE